MIYLPLDKLVEAVRNSAPPAAPAVTAVAPAAAAAPAPAAAGTAPAPDETDDSRERPER
jgi:hypothetical protein